MPTSAQIAQALQAADAAGDTASAQQLASAYVQQRALEQGQQPAAAQPGSPPAAGSGATQGDALTAQRSLAIAQSLGMTPEGLGAQAINYLGGLVDRKLPADSWVRRGSDAIVSNVVGAPVAAVHHAQNIPVGVMQGAAHLVSPGAGTDADNFAQQREATYQAGTPTNAGSLAGAAVGEIAPWMAGGGALRAAGAIPEATSFLGKVGMGAAEGLAQGVAQPVTSGGADYGAQKAEQVGLGALTGGAIPATINAPTALGKLLAGNISPETLALMQKAQAHGIDLTAPQVSTSYPMKAINAVTGQVPFSGAQDFAAKQQAQFNNAVARTIGAQETGALTPEVFNQALQDSGNRFNDLYGRNTLTIDQPLLKRLIDISNEAKQIPDANGTYNALNNNIDHIVKNAPDGVLPGNVFGLNDSALGRIHAQGGQSGYIYGKFQDALRDAMQGNMSPEDAQALADERGTYRNLMTVLPLVAKATGTDGNISPAALSGAVMMNGVGKRAMATGTRGDLGDLAAIGQRFLKQQVPDSGTASRTAVMKGLGALGTLGAGGAAAGGIPGAVTALGSAIPIVGAARAIQQGLRSRTLYNALGQAFGTPSGPVTNALGTLGTQAALEDQRR